MDTRNSEYDGKRVLHTYSESPEHWSEIKAGGQVVEDMQPSGVFGKVVGGPAMLMPVEYDDEGLMSHGIMRAWRYGGRIIC